MEAVQKIFNASRVGQQIVANVYSSKAGSSNKSHVHAKRLTLLFVHATGFHKELWEPVLQRLFAHNNNRWFIDNAIALDAYNHGDSAISNRKTISEETESPWFLNSRDILGVISQLGKPRNIIGIGHSWGATSLLLAEIMSPLTFAALVATDPVLYLKPNKNKMLYEKTLKRPCEWSDISAARQYFEPHPFFGIWDKRILDLYIKHGLETIPINNFNPDFTKLILKCRPLNEAAVFAGAHQASPHATNNLWKIQCPVAFLTGELSEISPPSYIAKIIKDIPDCQHVVMSDVGHLLNFQDPDGAANHYIGFLDNFSSKIKLPSSL
ncbi:alpha/beta-hydrolase [Coemansia reversa NRRL 1564]|uniref:Alpha/beta-hydrolase n=1 Tax=Coemansia reversa (strain ATCC 12441 / NRRL 1564) TaxID=763665 RepID=A0A2G5BL29_COERN|nr:alpha/beta-hydrolase [Coemansia reversa NRRL 1564]|eukprot:PIA19724.1 alpha/beta-hydrolase [Coemansia reversa NRRL 1564]